MNKYLKFCVTFSALLINSKSYSSNNQNNLEDLKSLILEQISEIEDKQKRENILLISEKEIQSIYQQVNSDIALDIIELSRLSVNLENILDRSVGTVCVC